MFFLVRPRNSYAATFFSPKAAHLCESQCAMPQQLLGSRWRQEKAKVWHVAMPRTWFKSCPQPVLVPSGRSQRSRWASPWSHPCRYAALVREHTGAPLLASRLVEAHRWSCVQPTYAGAGWRSSATHSSGAVPLTATAALPLCEYHC